MSTLTRSRSALAVGLALGVVFGIWNVLSAYLAPLADDSLAAIGAFSARRSGSSADSRASPSAAGLQRFDDTACTVTLSANVQ
jgi:hypothetical protein